MDGDIDMSKPLTPEELGFSKQEWDAPIEDDGEPLKIIEPRLDDNTRSASLQKVGENEQNELDKLRSDLVKDIDQTANRQSTEKRNLFSKLFRRNNDKPPSPTLSPEEEEKYQQLLESVRDERMNRITGNGEFDKAKLTNSLQRVQPVSEIAHTLKTERRKGMAQVETDEILEMRAARINQEQQIKKNSPEVSASDTQVEQTRQIFESEVPDTKTHVEDWSETPPLPFVEQNQHEKQKKQPRSYEISDFDLNIFGTEQLQNPDTIKQKFIKEDNTVDPVREPEMLNIINQFPDRFKGKITDDEGTTWDLLLDFGDRALDRYKQDIRLINSSGESVSTTVEKSIFMAKQGNTTDGIRYIKTPDGEWYGAVVYIDQADQREKISDYKPVSAEVGFNLMALFAPFQDRVDELRNEDISRQQDRQRNALQILRRNTTNKVAA